MDSATVESRVPPAPHRLRSMDTLRALLVAWVIAGHALLGYSTLGGWVYDQVAEVRFRPRVELALVVLLGPTGLFLMGTFFLIAGMFTSASLASAGPRKFLRRRLLRLGLPFAVTVVLIWPATVWMAYRANGQSRTYLSLVTGGWLHAGALWFAEVLLIFSVGYLLWCLAFGRPTRNLAMRGPHLLLLATGIAVASFVLRLWLPARASEPSDLHLWQWPELAGMFVLGIAGGRQMATRVPDDLVRACGAIALVTVASFPLLAALAGVHHMPSDSAHYLGGWHWQAALLALLGATLNVAGSVWLVGFAQRHFDGSGPVAAQAAAPASFAAFVLQNPILVALAVALRPLSAPAEVKAPLVAVLGVAGCFLLGRLMVTRTPLRRIL